MSEPQFNMVMDEAKREKYEAAMSDIVCWLGGFTSAGREYAPQTLQVLGDILVDIKHCPEEIPPELSPPTRFTLDYMRLAREIRFAAIQGIGKPSKEVVSQQKLKDIKRLAEKILDEK